MGIGANPPMFTRREGSSAGRYSQLPADAATSPAFDVSSGAFGLFTTLSRVFGSSSRSRSSWIRRGGEFEVAVESKPSWEISQNHCRIVSVRSLTAVVTSARLVVGTVSVSGEGGGRHASCALDQLEREKLWLLAGRRKIRCM